MSNVLIGIIGVILFIGLALAGALFLGPRFQESTNNSRAAATVQAVSQVVSAIGMREVQEGSVLPASTNLQTDLVATGYMKSVPANPTGGSPIYLIDGGGNPSSQPIRYVVLPLALDGRQKEICAAIVKQTGMTTDGTIPSGAVGPTHPVGCTWNGGEYYTAFARVR